MKKQPETKTPGRPLIFDVLYLLSAILLCLSIVIFMEGAGNAFYLYVVGAALYLLCHFRTVYRGDDFRLKRLNRIFFFNILLLVGGGYLMFIGNNSFILCMLVIAILEIFLNARTSHYLKEKQESE